MRHVLVTGGGKRIGRAIVELLARNGWDIAIHCNDSRDEAEVVARVVRAMGRIAIVVQADLQDEDAVRAMAGEAADALGGLNALVNNASVFVRDDVDTESRALWDLHMAVHMRAPFVLAMELLRQLPADHNGAIVNIADQRVLNPSRHFLSYTLSKMALWDQTQVLARAMAPRVRVNAVGPGPVLPSSRQSAEDFAQQALQTPLERVVQPEEVAAAVAFLLDAQAVTGQIIAVDAGQHLNWAYELPQAAPKE
jgi:NAD(P)-dependent dehydrogenase (short-subunit alcohol dehydrogenase family)